MDLNVKAILESAKATASAAAEKAGKMADVATKKAGDMANMTKLNLQIFDMNTEIDAVYKEIGKISYLSYVGDNSHEGELADKYAQISERLAKIAEIRETITNTKTTLECPSCGKECSREDVFCSKCGHKLS